MKISNSFYLTFWFKRTLAAVTCGYVIAFIIPPVLALMPYFGFLLALLYQPIIFWHFWGQGRGEFEYGFLESENNKLIRKSLIDLYGFRVGIEKYYVGETADFSDEINKLIRPDDIKEKINNNKMLRYFMHLRKANFALKNDSPDKMREELQAALVIEPDDLVPNFMLAQASEILGDSDQAIFYYKTSSGFAENFSQKLKIYIDSQIKRVEEKGPRKRLPNPGLRYLP